MRRCARLLRPLAADTRPRIVSSIFPLQIESSRPSMLSWAFCLRRINVIGCPPFVRPCDATLGNSVGDVVSCVA